MKPNSPRNRLALCLALSLGAAGPLFAQAKAVMPAAGAAGGTR